MFLLSGFDCIGKVVQFYYYGVLVSLHFLMAFLKKRQLQNTADVHVNQRN